MAGRRIPVTVDADTKGDFDKAADGLDKVAKKGDDADRSLRNLTKGHQVLDTEIGKVSRSIKDLRAEFEKTGDIDLLKDARKLEGTHKSLERLKKDFSDAGQDSGKGFASGFTDVFTDASGAIGKGLVKVAANPELAAIGAAAAVPVVAGLATALSGAALATVAAAGIAGGIVLASSSPAVQGAWSTFGHDALDQVQSAASSFEEPLVRAAHTFGDEISRDMPSIRKDFQILSPLVDDLAKGAAGFVHELQPGLQDAFKGAVPVIKEISRDLPELGADVSFFFSELGGSGQAGADALGLTIDALGGSLRVLGTGLREASVLFELSGTGALGMASKMGILDTAVSALTSSAPLLILGDLMDGNKNKSDDFSQSIEDLNRHMDEAATNAAFAEGMKVAQQSLHDGAQAASDMEQRLSDLARQMLNGKDATLAAKQGHLDLVQTLKDSKGSLDENTTAGLRSQGALVGQAQKALAVRDSVLAQTHSMEQADAAYDGLIAQIYADATANGISKAAVDGVIGSLKTIPRPNPVDIELRRQGYTDDDLREYKRSLLGATGTYTATVNTVRNTYFNEITRSYSERLPGPFAGGLAKGGMRTAAGIRHAAVGMLIPPSDPGTVLTGEPQTGGEVLTPLRGISQARAMQLTAPVAAAYDFSVVPNRQSGYASPVAVGGGGRGGNTYQITNYVAPGTSPADVGAATVESIRAYERLNGSSWRA